MVEEDHEFKSLNLRISDREPIIGEVIFKGNLFIKTTFALLDTLLLNNSFLIIFIYLRTILA